MSRRPLVAGNWKMHNDLSAARALMKGIRAGLAGKDTGVEVVVCTPSTLLYPMGREIDETDIKLAAQNVFFEPKGAFTGEISASMLKSAGCAYVIVGHSERRHVFGESGEWLRRKVAASLEAGLSVIYCVGETHEQRDSSETMSVVESQIDECLDGGLDASRIAVAYEPVWAIGTGRNATPDQAQDVHAFIRGKLTGVFGALAGETMRIQYGGSVKPGNARSLLACPDVDGALVGGACLVAEDFVSIIMAASAAKADCPA